MLAIIKVRMGIFKWTSMRLNAIKAVSRKKNQSKLNDSNLTAIGFEAGLLCYCYDDNLF